MVTGVLFKKSMQDMKRSLSQFISIFVMATVAISITVGLDSIWKTIENQSGQMYQNSNLSDIWITVPNPSDAKMWSIRRIAGVLKAERRFVVNAAVQIEGSPTLRVYAMPSGNTLNLPNIKSGEKLTKGGTVLDLNFAKAHRLSVGDIVKVEINDQKVDFRIDTLALSSEHIFSVRDAGSLIPDATKYGFIVVDEEKIAAAYGGHKPYNQILVRLNGNTDVKAVQNQIDSIFGKKLISVAARTDNSSMEMVEGKIQQFKTLATVFPLMFFLVTALITFSTMMRLVEDQRNQIGILKALGYSRRSIIWHYTSYGVYTGILGTVAGLLIGPILIGDVLISKLHFLLAFSDYRLSLNFPHYLLSSALIIFCTGGVSCYSCLKLQGEKPAALLRNRPPKNGNSIFLERIPRIWNNMKFSKKLIARNALQNKFRLIMSILGVMGCTGLIISAFTLYDMVSGITTSTYGRIYTYDQMIMLDDRTTDRDIKNLHLDGAVEDLEQSMVQITAANGSRRVAPISVFSRASPLIHLQDVDGKDVALPESGIAMTRKLAKLMNVKVGDTVHIKRSDDDYASVRIEKMVHMAAGQGIYMSDRYWEKIGEKYKPTEVLIKWVHPDHDFLNSNYVKSYVDMNTQKTDFEENLTAVKSAAFLLIAFGSILAFVVLYNMGILNFSERTRDLATLEVLGFRQKEIQPLVLTENFLSASIGILFGIPVGSSLTSILSKGFGDDLDLIGHITMDKILSAALMTILFAVIVNITVSKKIKKIDMLQALKSVE
ncbi:MAG: ABC-type antimicrobial peptide transport system, permease component [Lacrimispora sp.]|jgi:putative ABC transport system permease protein|nr:ABC-type antimicrobial peptide transport system, permease component [Lacrimispora sp.]